MTHETQDTVSDWAAATFGDHGSNIRVAARVNEEMAEALRADTAGKLEGEVAEECADTMIVAMRLGRRMGVTLLLGDYSHEHLVSSTGHLTCANSHLAKLMHHLAFSEVGAQSYLCEFWREMNLAMLALGFNCQGMIDAKMKINRNRKWKSDGTGHGYHLRDKT